MKRSIHRQVARAAAGKTVGQLTAELVAEYARHGLGTSPATAAVEATRIQSAGGPVGRLVALANQYRTAGTATRSLVHQLRETGPTPAWRRRPDTAVYRARGGTDYTLVDLTDNGRDVLTRHTVQQSMPFTAVDIWFTADADKATRVLAHVGPHLVGTVSAAAVVRLLPDMRAAAVLYDELAYTQGLVFSIDQHGAPTATRLQVRTPPPIPEDE